MLTKTRVILLAAALAGSLAATGAEAHGGGGSAGSHGGGFGGGHDAGFGGGRGGGFGGSFGAVHDGAFGGMRSPNPAGVFNGSGAIQPLPGGAFAPGRTMGAPIGHSAGRPVAGDHRGRGFRGRRFYDAYDFDDFGSDDPYDCADFRRIHTSRGWIWRREWLCY